MSLPSEFIKIIKTRRSIRQFRQEPVEQTIILECIDCARLAPSARNLQPLEYFLINEPELREQVFPLLRWASYIAPLGNPREGQHPTGYLVVLLNKELMQSHYAKDAGAAIENFILAAWANGIGTCWLASVERERLRTLLKIPEQYEIDSVVAFGYPAEAPVVENMNEIRYWLDEKNTLHVPKKPLSSLLHINGWNKRGD
ncbi:MAG TPA: nitroreductase family protein [Candidatus Marinimicrobia bacterium]|nr:nitroreductase family protein [Candidatus Neomarinimicrobiota bacterium]HRS51152.1 nitroreductase family protein [Candidatus Neomarinimicrobiota bacterium]HRU91609.1 nitroreductase family protein [Candidatus Neomarinimicrobiota bacterium]